MEKSLKIFMATHSTKCTKLPEWVIPIQVGSALSNKVFEDTLDNNGDHISYKNKQFCELTALYWIWKNSLNSDYIGLYHYRRYFKIDKNRIISSLKEYDVIIPKVKKLRISIKDQYYKEHYKEDWDVMIETLKKMYPDYYLASKKVFNNNKLYCYNMLISSSKIFNEYCEWLFPLLFEVEKQIDISDRDDYQKRYIGFLAERLFTLYIYYKKFKVLELKVNLRHNTTEISILKNIVNDCLFKLTQR